MKKLDLYYLTNCPFCGCGQLYTLCIELHDKPWVVECCRCHAQGPHADTEKEAFNLWNERVKEWPDTE